MATVSHFGFYCYKEGDCSRWPYKKYMTKSNCVMLNAVIQMYAFIFESLYIDSRIIQIIHRHNILTVMNSATPLSINIKNVPIGFC